MNCHLTLTKRTATGKGPARQLRREGKIPAVLYGQGETISLTLDPVEFTKVLRAKHQGYVLVELVEAGQQNVSPHNAILKDLQYDPINGQVLHVDFFEVAMDQPIQVTIPIVITGSTPIGVTLGGFLRQRQRSLPVEGLPADIPDMVVIDASGLGVGQTVTVKDLSLAKGVSACDDLDRIVVNIVEKKKAAEATESGGGEATQGATGAATSST